MQTIFKQINPIGVHNVEQQHNISYWGAQLWGLTSNIKHYAIYNLFLFDIFHIDLKGKYVYFIYSNKLKINKCPGRLQNVL